MNLGRLQFDLDHLRCHGQLMAFQFFWETAALQWQGKMAGIARSSEFQSLTATLALERIDLAPSSAERLFQKNRPLAGADYAEVLGCGWVRAVDLLRTASYKGDRPLGHRQIQDTHAALLQFDPEAQFYRGIYASEEKEKEMEDLLAWLGKAWTGGEAPLVLIPVFLVHFLAIHPFKAANSLLARMLVRHLLALAKLDCSAAAALEPFLLEQKEEMVAALRAALETITTESPDYLPWVSFFWKALLEQFQAARQAVLQEQEEASALSPLAAKILLLAREPQPLTVQRITQRLLVNRNTVKKQLEQLVKAEALTLHGKGKGAWYGLRHQ